MGRWITEISLASLDIVRGQQVGKTERKNESNRGALVII